MTTTHETEPSAWLVPSQTSKMTDAVIPPTQHLQILLLRLLETQTCLAIHLPQLPRQVREQFQTNSYTLSDIQSSLEAQAETPEPSPEPWSARNAESSGVVSFSPSIPTGVRLTPAVQTANPWKIPPGMLPAPSLEPSESAPPPSAKTTTGRHTFLPQSSAGKPASTSSGGNPSTD